MGIRKLRIVRLTRIWDHLDSDDPLYFRCHKEDGHPVVEQQKDHNNLALWELLRVLHKRQEGDESPQVSILYTWSSARADSSSLNPNPVID